MTNQRVPIVVHRYTPSLVFPTLLEIEEDDDRGDMHLDTPIVVIEESPTP